MRVKIKDNALTVHFQNQLCARFPNQKFVAKLKQLEGCTIECDTTKLLPKDYVLVDGTMIPERYIESIVDDVREDFIRCQDCGRSVHKDVTQCPSCFSNDFIDIFTNLPVGVK
jgi:hypothetical protein